MSEADPQANTETPSLSPFVEQLRVPQFGILHLMLWTAITAVLLKVSMALTDNSLRQMLGGQFWILQVYQTANAIMVASMAVGAGVLIRLRCYTMFKRLQPGHWLVLISTLEFLLNLAVSLLYWLASVKLAQASPAIHVAAVVAYALAAAVYPFAFFQLRDARRWKVLIGVKGLGAVTSAALGVVFLVAPLSNRSLEPLSMLVGIRYWPVIWAVTVFVILLMAAALDLYHRTARDWVHWLGVSVLGVGYVLAIALQVYFLFFFRFSPPR